MTHCVTGCCTYDSHSALRDGCIDDRSPSFTTAVEPPQQIANAPESTYFQPELNEDKKELGLHEKTALRRRQLPELSNVARDVHAGVVYPDRHGNTITALEDNGADCLYSCAISLGGLHDENRPLSSLQR